MGMIIETRYRDIPFEEAMQCYEYLHPSKSAADWKRYRGQPVTIVTPPIDISTIRHMRCKGPFYATQCQPYDSKWRVVVCPHIAEIGD